MKKVINVLLVIAILTLTGIIIYSAFSIPLTRAGAVNVLTKESTYESYYSSRIFDAEAKRDWVRAEMSGTAPELRQEEAITAYIDELRRVRNEHAKTFSDKYSLFRRLRLI
ncbi:MAG: hypothetical protein UY31_C0038G0005 [Candidatus Wolfebacteria bacterium GW2011_GWE1_48_7]|nr:MAG: hypothetical protein UX49_C0012G0007 [Candidatus Wolfebacteria bacterium GW2011_GWC2_46_275]KKU41476.1 MAG: hypothetical protein UX58_C0008G0042 [Candidatus Wolfebacteria bacterium GW2011_GWB2_46_69]KKU53584.1 MAG: hypothetical protein UX76_C0013G0012 [Candidatus Wolfebacteria bacterium GW2011_GWC1_47_103]KKU65448.1 MAG: hypothetical protein UX90_C0005G0012 [Candidatus Wolfebacteria bacterium GW2011_GWD2_47_17]KKU72838.1 MAG: hypothetical protein UX96_C0013G0012 [Candidatus Wolfebacteri